MKGGLSRVLVKEGGRAKECEQERRVFSFNINLRRNGFLEMVGE